MKIYMKLALRYIKSYEKRSIALMLAIALSSFLIITIGSLSESARRSNANYMRKTIGVQHVRYNKLNLEQVEKIKNNENINVVGNASYYDEGIFENRIAVNLISSDENMLYIDNTKLLDGRYPVDSNEIAIEEWVLERLKLPNKTNQTIGLSIKGKMKNYKLVGIVKNREKIMGDGKLEGYLAFRDESLPNKNHIYSFVEFKEDTNIITEIDKLAKEIGITDKKDIKLNTMLLDSIGKLNSIDYDLIKTSLILMITGGMVIYSLYSVSVLKRIQEYGIIRAIGSTEKGIISVVLLEIIIIYTIGICIGLLLSIFSVNLFQGSTTDLFTEGSTKLDTIMISKFSIGIAVITSLISTILAALRGVMLGLKLSPIEAMTKITQDENIKYKYGFIEKIIGITKKISYKNIMRNKKSFIFTISAMAIGCVLFTYQSFTYEMWNRDLDYRKTVEKALSYDFRLHLNPKVSVKEGYSKEQIENLKKIDGIKDVYTRQVLYSKLKINKSFINKPYGMRELEMQDESARSLDGPIEYRYIFDGDDKDELIINSTVLGLSNSDLKDLREVSKQNFSVENMNKEYSAILVIPKTRIDINKEYEEKNLTDVFNYKVGDKLNVTIPKKSYEKNIDDFKVSAEYEEYKDYYVDKEFQISGIVDMRKINNSDMDSSTFGVFIGRSPAIIISENIFKEFSGIDKYRIVSVDMKDGANYESVKNDIQSMAEIFFDTWVEDYTGLSEETKRTRNQYDILRYSIIIVLLFISGLSIFNNINYNLMSRIREHGIIKAVGATNRQFKKMIRFEGLMYGSISAIFSCTISLILQFGVFIYYAYYRDWLLLKVFFINPKPYLVVILINILIGYIATLSPSKQVKKIEITEAIRTIQ